MADTSMQRKVDEAINLIKEQEPAEGYYLGFSGGKDSLVVYDLAKRAGVKFEAWFVATGLDDKETLKYIKNFEDVKVAVPPGGGFWQYLKKYGGFLPSIQHRWCCALLKEWHGNDKTKLLGIRATEGKKRAQREPVGIYKGTKWIYPIFYWTDTDVWMYIKSRGLFYNPLYDKGYKRIGCVFCPYYAGKLKAHQAVENVGYTKALIQTVGIEKAFWWLINTDHKNRNKIWAKELYNFLQEIENRETKEATLWYNEINLNQ